MQGELLFCQRNTFARRGLDFIRTTERAIDVNEQTPRLIIIGLNFAGTLVKGSSALELASNETVACIEVMCFEGIRIESDGTLQLGFRFLETFGKGESNAAAGMRLGQPVIQLKRFPGGSHDVLNRFLRFVLEVMIEEKGITGGNAGVSAGVARIELDRFGEHPPRDLIITLGVSMKEFPAAQIISVGFDVICLRPLNRFFLLRQQLNGELFYNRARDFVLNGKDIGQVTIKTIGPKVPAVPGAD